MKEDHETFLEDNKNIQCEACGKDLEEAALDSELSRTLSEITNEKKDEESLILLTTMKMRIKDLHKNAQARTFNRLSLSGLSFLPRLQKCP